MAKNKSEQKTDPLAPGHHIHRYYGYNVNADGSIELAPGLCAAMDAAVKREEGLRQLLAETNRFVAQELAQCAEDKRIWWNSIREEVPGLDDKATWFYRQDRRIIEKKKGEDKPVVNT